MKFFAGVIALSLCSIACAAEKLEVFHDVASVAQEANIGSIGGKPVTLRPVLTEKKNDAPRAALFVGSERATKTPIFPGKTYYFLVTGDGKALVNGFTDTGRAGPDEILAKLRAKAPAHAITTVGHRGVHMHAPENTRVSYVQAIDAKTPIVEFDTALTADGHIVGMHDKTVDRTTDGEGEIAALTLEQVKKLDAGNWKDAKFKGEPVPTIDDVAEVVRGKAILMLDLKAEGQGKAIAEWLAKSKFPRDQVILAPWEDAEGVDLRRYVPDVPMIRLAGKIPTEIIDDAYFARMKQIGFSGFSLDWKTLSAEFIKAAQKNGMKVYTWTLNDPADIAGAVLNGVDGVITDDPAATMKLIAGLTAR